MKHISLIAIFLFLIPSFNSVAQEYNLDWSFILEKDPNRFEQTNLAFDNEGNLVVIGWYRESFEFDPSSNSTILAAGSVTNFFIAKYTVEGELLWARTSDLGMPGSSTLASSLQIDTDGNIYLTGWFTAAVDFDMTSKTQLIDFGIGKDCLYLSKYNAQGDLLWVKGTVFGRDAGIVQFTQKPQLALLSGNELLLTTWYEDSIDVNMDAGVHHLFVDASGHKTKACFIAKYDTSGNFISAQNFDSPGQDLVQSLKVDSKGNYYAVIVFQDSINLTPNGSPTIVVNADNLVNSLVVAKYNNGGQLIWNRHLYSSAYAQMHGYYCKATLDNNDNYYLLGIFRDDLRPDPNNASIVLTSPVNTQFLAKYDKNGNYLWSQKHAISSAGNSAFSLVKNKLYISLMSDSVFWDLGDPTSLETGLHQSIARFDLNGKYETKLTFHITNSSPSLGLNSMAVNNDHEIFQFYSLKGQIDMDPSANTHFLSSALSGTVASSMIVGKYNYKYLNTEDSSEFASTSYLKVFPNPTEGQVSIQLSKERIIEFKLYSLEGQLLFSEKTKSDNENLMTIDLSAYPNGVYFIECLTNKKKFIEKVILN